MLIFVHIPKTGGTSLRAALGGGNFTTHIHAHHFSNYVSLSHDDSFEWMAMRAEGAKVAAGHIPYGLHEYIDDDYDYVTVLRHPVERVLSKYRMPAQVRSQAPIEFVKTSTRFQNLAVRQLCGLGIDFEGEVTEGHYNTALENLNNIKYIGFTRELPQLWERLKKDYGFKGQLYHHSASSNPRNNHSRVNNKIENVDSATADGILAYNQWDLKLYEKARQLQRVL